MGDIQLLQSISYLESTFGDNLRLNNKGNSDYLVPKITLNVLSHVCSSCLIELGNTKLIAGVNIKSTKSVKPDFLSYISVDLNLSSARLISSINSTKTSRLITEYLHSIVESSLNELNKELVHVTDSNTDKIIGSYQFLIDIVVLNDDGCLLDASVPCTFIALKNCKWPQITGENAAGEFIVSDSCISLSSIDIPIFVSFLISPRLSKAQESKFDPTIIVQPSSRECLLWDVDAPLSYIVLNSDNEIVDMQLLNNFGTYFYSSNATTHDLSLQTNIYKFIIEYVKVFRKLFK